MWDMDICVPRLYHSVGLGKNSVMVLLFSSESKGLFIFIFLYGCLVICVSVVYDIGTMAGSEIEACFK